jgi:hypothetical protein
MAYIDSLSCKTKINKIKYTGLRPGTPCLQTTEAEASKMEPWKSGAYCKCSDTRERAQLLGSLRTGLKLQFTDSQLGDYEQVTSPLWASFCIHFHFRGLSETFLE